MNDDRRHRPTDASRTVIDAIPSDPRELPSVSRYQQSALQSRRTSRLAVPDPMDQRRQPMRRPMRDEDYGYDDDYDYGRDRRRDDRRDGVHVEVNNGGQYYRPWKEELLLSGFKTIGNLIAWPFRLVGGLLGSALRFAMFAIVVPCLLFGAIGFYQSHRDRPAAETAHEIGRSGVGIVGSVFSGIWDGIFGSKEPEKASSATPSDDAPAAKAKGDENPAWEAEAKRVQKERASR